MNRPAPPPRRRLIAVGRRRSRRRVQIALLAAIVLAVASVPAIARLMANLLWFQEVGYTRVLLTGLGARVALFLVVAALVFAVVYGVARWAQRGPAPFFLKGPDGATLDVTGVVRRLTLPAALLLAVLFGWAATGEWMTVLQALYATPFGTADPVFGRDIGFYVLVLPLVAALLGLLFTLGVVALVVAFGSAWLRRQVVVDPSRGLVVEPGAARQLAILGALLFVVIAASTWLVRLPALLYSTTGPLVGLSYTDFHAVRPGLHVVALAALAAAGLLVVYARRRRLVRGALYAVGGFAVVSLLARVAYPAAVQRLAVDPTELTRERPFLAHHIELTHATTLLREMPATRSPLTGALRE